MAAKVLSKTQEKFLRIFRTNSLLYSNFTLSGGTALAEFYLHHRYSEDLDFFSTQEINPNDIFLLLKAFLKPLGFKKIEFHQSFNRNLYFFIKKGDVLKIEFTYFPFEPLQKPITNGDLKIDSLKDIAVNKAFTIYQKPRMRDFVDLYFILRQKKWKLDELLKLVRIKFDTHIDSLQWGTQLLKVKTLKDYPRMLVKADYEKIFDFFAEQAKLNQKNIIK